MSIEKNSKLIIISSPSGAGKTTLCKLLIKKMKNVNLSISYTSRSKRLNEVNGKDYHFVSKDSFLKLSNKNYFIETAKKLGHTVDCVDLYKENFNPIFAGEKPDETVLDHRKRIEEADAIVLIAPIWNFRMPAIVEGWIDKVLSPPWAFSFKKIFGNSHENAKKINFGRLRGVSRVFLGSKSDLTKWGATLFRD